MRSLGAPTSPAAGMGTAARGCAYRHGLGQHQDLQFLSQFCHLVALICPCCAGVVVLAPLLELRAPGEDTGTVPAPTPAARGEERPPANKEIMEEPASVLP